MSSARLAALARFLLYQQKLQLLRPVSAPDPPGPVCGEMANAPLGVHGWHLPLVSCQATGQCPLVLRAPEAVHPGGWAPLHPAGSGRADLHERSALRGAGIPSAAALLQAHAPLLRVLFPRLQTGGAAGLHPATGPTVLVLASPAVLPLQAEGVVSPPWWVPVQMEQLLPQPCPRPPLLLHPARSRLQKLPMHPPLTLPGWFPAAV